MSFLNPEVEAELKKILEKFQCQGGAVHVVNGGQLFLVAAVGMSKQVLQMISVVPMGRGMAGLAAERKEAVQVCHVQEDESGVSPPGAKAMGLEGAVAVPVWGEVGGIREVKAVLGVGKKEAYEFSPEEIAMLIKEAEVFLPQIES